MRNGVPKPKPRMDESKRRRLRNLTAVVTDSFHEFCIRANRRIRALSAQSCSPVGPSELLDLRVDERPEVFERWRTLCAKPSRGCSLEGVQ